MIKKQCFYCSSYNDLIFDEFGMIYICRNCKENEEYEFSN